MNLEVVRLEIRRAEDIAPAMDSLGTRADALYVVTDPLVNTNRVRINSLAAAARVPTVEAEKDYVEAGGLLSYGPDFADLFRRAAEFVDKILPGANPGDIPVEEPTKFDLAVNLATAKALGIVVHASLLARADNVIE
jgi:putative ABC transport system substrate-binding protein